MPLLTPTTLIFVNSKNRISGTPWDFNINFNDELIKAPKGHYIQLNVEQVSINRSWYSIQDGYNTFRIDNGGGNFQTITIPVGYYNAFELRAILQQLLPTWTFTYDKKVNKFTYTAPAGAGNWVGITERKFIFSNSSISDMFGFDLTETPTFTQASLTVVSSKPIKVNEDQSIIIHTNLPRQKMSALDNTYGQTIIESDILCAIPILSAPFDNVVFTRNNTGDFSYNVLAPVVHGLRIYVTNEQNTFLKVPYDWIMILSIKYVPYETNETTSLIRDLRDYARLLLLQNMPTDTNEDGDNNTNQIISQ